ncbi:glycosyltransferase [Tamilnaduibacter salinus]|uniref:Glycosyltransferase n=1 Tax=Tamilnaduibacter salinus TaxID=1484056 RepID=A0A2A2I4V3_9GAMM|nr:glycosyltransferase [Tamilnaduibacter salinus]PAV27041.1 glycosyltransferase [Tamilnaduibacter salinus]
MRPLRILQFITPAGFYGAERWVLALVNNLDSEHVTPFLAVTDEGGGQDLTFLDYWPGDKGEISRIAMNGRFDWRAIDRLSRVIRDRKIDVLHTHGYKSDIVGWMAARKAGIPCVSTPHGFPTSAGLKMRLFIGAGSFLLRYFNAVAPLSEALQRDMQRLKVPAERTRMIQNGVDLKEIDEALASDVGEHDLRTPGCFTIGYIGQMIPRKGLRHLLSAFDRFHAKYPESQLVLVGDGGERSELEALAQSMASGQAIHFAGFRADRLRLLRQFDVFAMTSALEGIPRCMMEAMAVGTPVVAYDIPGVDLLIEQGVTGLSVQHGDDDGLSQCFETVLEDSRAASARAEAARQLIEEQYSARRMALEYEQVFRELRDQGHLATPAAQGAVS